MSAVNGNFTTVGGASDPDRGGAGAAGLHVGVVPEPPGVGSPGTAGADGRVVIRW
ncbi:MAG: hypothetical protein H6745_28225 [Deltaproteobacteria bacterium]|nr:hypothetical protein [Deltaproteobacteria bacterium]